MRRFACLCLAGVLVGCGEQQQAESTNAAETTAPAALTVADLTGTWNVEVRGEASDSVLLRYTLNATGDTATWSIQLPDRPDPIPIHIMAIGGDSAVFHAGPYPSALQPGVQVWTHGVSRLQNGMLTGTTTAHYSVTTPDSVRVLRTMGMRAN